MNDVELEQKLDKVLEYLKPCEKEAILKGIYGKKAELTYSYLFSGELEGDKKRECGLRLLKYLSKKGDVDNAIMRARSLDNRTKIDEGKEENCNEYKQELIKILKNVDLFEEYYVNIAVKFIKQEMNITDDNLEDFIKMYERAGEYDEGACEAAGRMYEEIGDLKKAIEIYDKLVNEFEFILSKGENEYYYDKLIRLCNKTGDYALEIRYSLLSGDKRHAIRIAQKNGLKEIGIRIPVPNKRRSDWKSLEYWDNQLGKRIDSNIKSSNDAEEIETLETLKELWMEYGGK